MYNKYHPFIPKLNDMVTGMMEQHVLFSCVKAKKANSTGTGEITLFLPKHRQTDIATDTQKQPVNEILCKQQTHWDGVTKCIKINRLGEHYHPSFWNVNKKIIVLRKYTYVGWLILIF